jgi:putative transposase
MSETYQSLSHSKWDCKYHVVFVPKRRREAIFGQARKQLGPIFHALARQKECQIIEGHLLRAIRNDRDRSAGQRYYAATSKVS